MTRTVLFASNASVDHAPLGQPSASLLVRKVVQLINKGLLVALAPRQRDADQAHPWLSDHIQRNMSTRARRLMRADY
jgi:hypothetical protein